MSKSIFKLESLHKVGQLADDFDSLLVAAVRDCKARPGIVKPREITIRVRLTPNKQDPDQVVVASTVVGKSPAREALPYLMDTTVNGGLKFAPSSPMEPDQGELFDE